MTTVKKRVDKMFGRKANSQDLGQVILESKVPSHRLKAVFDREIVALLTVITSRWQWRLRPAREPSP